MTQKKLHHFTGSIDQNIQITGSKSETNRLLILQQLYANLNIENILNSDDSKLMQRALASDEKDYKS